MTTPDATGQVEVAAPAERVYELVSRPEVLAELADEYSSYRWLDGASSATVGARFRGSNRRGVRRWSTTATITEADAPHRFAFDVSIGRTPISRWEYAIDPTGDGCRVTESTWSRAPGWMKLVGRLATGVGNRAEHNRHNIANTLRRLKTRAETG